MTQMTNCMILPMLDSNTLIIRPGALGDTLMVLPALVDIGHRASVTFVGRRPGLDFAKDFVECTMDFEGPGWHRLFMKRPDGHQRLPVTRSDLVVAFFGKQKRAISQNLKFYFPHASINIFPSLPPEGRNIHAALHIAICLRSSGLPVDTERSMENAAKRPLLGTGPSTITRNKVVFHPGSGDTKKNHPPDFWLALFGRFEHDAAFQRLRPVFLLGPSEERLCQWFKEKLRSTGADIRLSPEKGDLVRLLREAAIYIGHDSGITHVAAMLNTPTVALFKKGNVNEWRPLGPRVRVIRREKAGPQFLEEVMVAARLFVSTTR